MDGVLADLGTAHLTVKERVSATFTPAESVDSDDAENEAAADETQNNQKVTHRELKLTRRRRDAIWREIKATPDFWMTLPPTDPSAVRRIQTLAIRYNWDVVFITQRPATAGDTVQRQTQRWLVKQGFEFPSVIVLNGSRGAAAGALGLDYLVDDTPKNCIDVKSESGAKLLLVTDKTDDVTLRSATRLDITIVPTIGAALDVLERASVEPTPRATVRHAQLVEPLIVLPDVVGS